MPSPFSFVAGWVVPYRRTPLANVSFGWPFGRADAYDDRLVLTVRGPLRKLFGRRGRRTIELAAITDVRRVGAGPLNALRISHTTDAVGRVTVTARRPAIDQLVGYLDERGVSVN